ncbi:MAG: DUF3784 domain-containing protein [Oscillospiraceae bacterium]|nr:DUF3784 domain-containing protein [Oscillospiraceae bacterium]
MLALKIIAVIVGLAFTLFGYLIFFKKRYSLINGFDEDLRAGRKTEEYAKMIGLIEFTAGIAVLIAAVVLIIFD